MTEREPKLLLFHAPLLRQAMTTPKAMRDVIYALLPATGAAVWFFGLSAILVLSASVLGAVAAEWLFGSRAAGAAGCLRGRSLLDGSGLLTGLLLG
ncbi:MAG: RnfABCDGE type electron transport complex subunit D, partial [Proteobacteria bacterium]|nr:RnfABCDGE type electron transport complex subunit D [Pseudomonadota bacterium]